MNFHYYVIPIRGMQVKLEANMLSLSEMWKRGSYHENLDSKNTYEVEQDVFIKLKEEAKIQGSDRFLDLQEAHRRKFPEVVK